MQLIKKTKKGFTLVELIVVIAIVAILAAVSVVSYIAFINSANESADISLVKQLNLALQADEALHGKRSTMHEMLLDMEENGFVVENLTKTKSGYDIVWDQEHNRFGLFDGEKKIYGESSLSLDHEQYIWKFVDNKAEADAITDSTKFYSMYLTEAYINEAVRTIEVKSGIDVGINVLNEVTYNHLTGNGQTVTIRTNSEETRVNINGKQGNNGDTVKHYGVAANVFENSCGKNSYDEYGYIVGFIFSQDGHVHVYSKSDSNISASAVVVINTNVTIDVDDETPVIYAGLTQEEIAEVQANISAENNTYVVGGVTPVYNEQDLENSSGGIGTDVSPFIIATPEKFEELLDGSAGEYFKLFKDITLDVKDFDNYAFVSEFNGHFDGNERQVILENTTGKALAEAQAKVYRIFENARGELNNFTIVNNTGYYITIARNFDMSGSIVFNNVNYGYEGVNKTLISEQEKSGLFVNTNIDCVTFNNCKNYYNIDALGGYSAIFIGGRAKSGADSEIQTFNYCYNYGDIFSADGFGILMGNTNGNRNKNDVRNLIVYQCYNYGKVSSFKKACFLYGANNGSKFDNDSSIPQEQLICTTVGGEFNDLTGDGTKVTISDPGSSLQKQYILTKGTLATSIKLTIYQSFKVYLASDHQVGLFQLSFNIAEEINITTKSSGDILEFRNCAYYGYDLWKETYNNGNEYVGTWKTTNEGSNYFYYDTGSQGMWVIDYMSRYEKYLLDNGLNKDDCYLEQDDLSTNPSVKMFA